jgi:hypothetical protein
MTSHQFAKQLLEGPDLPILVPRVVEYDDEQGGLETPIVTQDEALTEDEESRDVLIISYAPNTSSPNT